jgi:hypothetical protein
LRSFPEKNCRAAAEGAAVAARRVDALSHLLAVQVRGATFSIGRGSRTTCSQTARTSPDLSEDDEEEEEGIGAILGAMQGGIGSIFGAMQGHPESEEVQEAGCKALQNLAANARHCAQNRRQLPRIMQWRKGHGHAGQAAALERLQASPHHP